MGYRNRQIITLFLMATSTFAFAEEAKPVIDKSPSKDKIQWTGAETSLETTFQQDIVFAGNTDLGNNTHGDLS